MTRHIMVVDDEEDTQKMIDLILEPQGFTTLKAYDAAQAIEMLDGTTPELIIIDIMMPGTDGIVLCSQVRARPQTAETPIIVLTARDDTVTLEQSYQAGADQYLTKPILPQNLIALVNRMLRS